MKFGAMCPHCTAIHPQAHFAGCVKLRSAPPVATNVIAKRLRHNIDPENGELANELLRAAATEIERLEAALTVASKALQHVLSTSAKSKHVTRRQPRPRAHRRSV